LPEKKLTADGSRLTGLFAWGFRGEMVAGKDYRRTRISQQGEKLL
jgi:hypothetical protein